MRAGLLAGRYQHRFGYVNNVAYDPHNQLMGLPETEKTIASRLQDTGYRTGMVGKWHLGAAAPFHPLKRGFDFFYGFLGGGHDYFIVDTTVQLAENYKAALDNNGTPVGLDGYLTDVLTDQAIRFINEADEQPFFLYVAYNAPHGPLQAPENKVAQFKSIQDKKRRTYAAMVSAMDDQIGRILETLDERGDRQNTLIAFLSDNGGPENSNASDNGPLRGQKGDVFDGGIHVPFVMRWPDALPAGVVFELPVISIDVSQTALEVAGAATAANPDGVNVVPYVRGEKTTPPHEALFWRTGQDVKQAVRRGDDKLVVLDGQPSLYDLAQDIEESIDLAPIQGETTKELTALFDLWNAGNQPSLFPSYREYHEMLKTLHKQIQQDSQADD